MSRAAASALQPAVMDSSAVALQQCLATREVVNRIDYTTMKGIIQSVEAPEGVALELHNLSVLRMPTF